MAFYLRVAKIIGEKKNSQNNYNVFRGLLLTCTECMAAVGVISEKLSFQLSCKLYVDKALKSF